MKWQRQKQARSTLRVGIPRALGHYLYPELWETFLTALGVRVMLSAPTSRKTIEQAGLRSETEHCLPFKLFDAHLAELVGHVDLILIPRILSMRRGHIACPKLGALPDSARAQLPDGTKVITVDLDERHTPLAVSLAQVGRMFHAKKAEIRIASALAQAALEQAHQRESAAHGQGALRFLLIGHPYNLHDPYLSEMIVRALTVQGVGVTPVSFACREIEPKPLAWDMCSVIHDQLTRLDPREWAGVIQLSSFNCGCDSIASVLFKEVLAEKGIPCMTLVLDEHAGLAGIETRLEAFVDSIKERHAVFGH